MTRPPGVMSLFFLLVSFIFAFCFVNPAEAAEARIISSTFESRFPAGMNFKLEAATVRPTSRVTLNYRVAGRRTIVTGDAQFVQSTGSIRAETNFDLGRRYLPPGTTLQFHWVILDDRGEQFRSPVQQIVVTDGRFQWKQVRMPNVDVNWYMGDDTFGRQLLATASRALAQLVAETRVSLTSTVRVFVYGTIDDFRAASYRGGLEWVGGTYYPQESVILIYAPPDEQGAAIIRTALPHELTHAVIHQVTDNPFGDVPQWLNEGLATRSDARMPSNLATALAEGVAARKLFPIRALSGSFPVDPDEAILAYAESYSVVTFLVERYGRERVNALLRAYREGVTQDAGLQQALGKDLSAIEEEWRAWLAPWMFMKTSPFPNEETVPIVEPTAEVLIQAIGEWLRQSYDSVTGRR